VRTRNYRLTWEDAQAIRELYRNGWRQYDLAVKFQISQSHVSEILRGHKWKIDTSTTKLRGRPKGRGRSNALHPLLRDSLQALKQEES
jgi:uncharacterized protein YjcR